MRFGADPVVSVLDLNCKAHQPTPPGRAARLGLPAEVASPQLVFAASDLAGHEASVALADGSRTALLHDPDGHTLLLIENA